MDAFLAYYVLATGSNLLLNARMERKGKSVMEFSTSNLSLAAALAMTNQIISIDKSNPRKATFVFEKTPELDEQVKKYWDRKMELEPQAYFDQIKSMKARLYE